ncbi:MAG: hypothetical protein ACK4S4_02430 [Pyrinomonadaceae bacterium]
METNELARQVFAIDSKVRYVAIYDNGELSLNQREGIADASSSESDKYEELIVNPTILKIATQRGNIDCGGLEYYVIKYGSFYLISIPTAGGHVSVGVENDGDPVAIAASVRELLG